MSEWSCETAAGVSVMGALAANLLVSGFRTTRTVPATDIVIDVMAFDCLQKSGPRFLWQRAGDVDLLEVCSTSLPEFN